MKTTYLFSIIIIVCATFSCQSKKEKLLISGSGWTQIAIIDKETEEIEWSYPLNRGDDCNDVELTPEGNILYAYTKGARLINRKKETIWDHQAREREELFTATRLPSGNYMLGICGNPSRIVELNSEGKQVKETTFESGIANVHSQFRQMIKTPRNTYIVPLMGKGVIVEINEQGGILDSVSCGGVPFSVKILDNGNWLVSCGDAHSFVEINPQQKQIVQTVGRKDIETVSLHFVAELIRYKNGNTLIANWSGHSRDKSQPLLLEIDRDNYVVWSLSPNPEIVDISTVFSFFE